MLDRISACLRHWKSVDAASGAMAALAYLASTSSPPVRIVVTFLRATQRTCCPFSSSVVSLSRRSCAVHCGSSAPKADRSSLRSEFVYQISKNPVSFSAISFGATTERYLRGKVFSFLSSWKITRSRRVLWIGSLTMHDDLWTTQVRLLRNYTFVECLVCLPGGFTFHIVIEFFVDSTCGTRTKVLYVWSIFRNDFLCFVTRAKFGKFAVTRRDL